jgi:hypothetical protein
MVPHCSYQTAEKSVLLFSNCNTWTDWITPPPTHTHASTHAHTRSFCAHRAKNAQYYLTLQCNRLLKLLIHHSCDFTFNSTTYYECISHTGTTDLAIIIIHFFSYEASPSLRHTTANHNSGVGIAFSRSLAVVQDVYIIAAVTVYCLAIVSLAWMTRPKVAEKHMNTVVISRAAGEHTTLKTMAVCSSKKASYHLHEHMVSQHTRPQLTTTIQEEDTMNGILNIPWI